VYLRKRLHEVVRGEGAVAGEAVEDRTDGGSPFGSVGAGIVVVEGGLVLVPEGGFVGGGEVGGSCFAEGGGVFGGGGGVGDYFGSIECSHGF